jgi:hypothetical protein
MAAFDAEPQLVPRVFPLPCLDKKEGDRAGSVDGEARDSLIDPGIAALAAMGITAMGP